MDVALGDRRGRGRIDARFCSHSCRQQSYNARKNLLWEIDGEKFTGQELVDRGWTLAVLGATGDTSSGSSMS
jgi:hypothetical protein